MLLLIAATGWLVISGIFKLPAPVAIPEPEKSAPKPTFSSADFLKVITASGTGKSADSFQKSTPSTLATDTAEEVFREQAERLWVHVSQYQSNCGVGAPLSKSDFMESLRQTPLKRILESRGSEFAVSQDLFIKGMLGNDEIVKLCKSGRSGLFFSILEFQRSNWDRQIQEAKDFASQERVRVSSFIQAEQFKATASNASARQAFLGAAIAFGLFMCVALVLIFARLELNLRGVHTIARERQAE